MAGDAKKKSLAGAMADLRISLSGFESWIPHWARGSKKKGGARDVVAELPDDVLVDILSRLPIKSLCRCKLVSTRWRNLISHPEHRKKLPQTVAGFFYESYARNRFPKLARHFTNVSGAVDPFIDPSLSFLPEYKSIDIKDSCNGLLLCHCRKHTDPETMDSVVCNPATEKWVVVPDSGWSTKVRITRLGFDPAVSSHFHVFEFIPDDIWYIDDDDDHTFGGIVVVAVYSSKTGFWNLNNNNHLPIPFGEFVMPQDSKCVFFNGILHLTTFFGVVLAIDVEGKVLRGIPCPISAHYDYDVSRPVDVYLSQGHLYLTTISNGHQPSIWVLEDYNGENWTLKYNVNTLHLFGAAYCPKYGDNFSIISIHPEHNMIFMVWTDTTLLSYEMDHMRLRFISQLGWNYTTHHIPYVPLFSESLADEQ